MEKVCFEIENVEVTYLDKTVLEIERLAVHQFDRIGIVGKNGAGKSTLLKIMAGMIQPTKGKVRSHINFGYLDQLAPPTRGEVDYELLGKLAVTHTEIENFSGGEQTRFKLAQIFSTYKEGLLLDEPTTHLDSEGIRFIIDALAYYYGALVLVSHDRYVLDQLVEKIWEVEDGRVTEYTGTYSDYVAEKERERKQQQEQHEQYVKEKVRLTKAAEEKMQKAGKINETKEKGNRMFETKSKGTSQKSIQRAAKALEQRAEQLEKVEAPKEERVIRFHQSEALQLHNKFPIMADRLHVKAGEKQILEEASFQFPLGETIAITGENGSGKTTLLQYIRKRGEGLTISPKVVFGAYEQMDYQFEANETVLDYMKKHSDYPESKIRSVLHSMNFTGNDVKKNIRTLSGGEAIRLVLCQLFLGRYNVLLLDEPTNFLDVFCIEALERFIQGYEGTIILVSHDQTFIERVADSVYAMEDNKLVLQ